MAKPKLPKDLKGIKFTTPTFRLSFPDLFEPKAYKDGGEKHYKITMLFPKDQDISEIKKHIIAAAKEAFGPSKTNWPKNLSLPWRDGDDNSDYEGYSGCYYLSAKSKRKPIVINRNKERIIDPEEIYGGCYARAVVVAKATESGGKFYVTLYLQGVQFVKDGERFGSGVNVDEDFNDDDLEDLEEDDAANYEDSDESEDDDDDMGF